jgi:hypothetical protein
MIEKVLAAAAKAVIFKLTMVQMRSGMRILLRFSAFFIVRYSVTYVKDAKNIAGPRHESIPATCG